MHKLISTVFCLQLGLWALSVGAAGYPPIYVDPQRGDDGNDGSEEHPFKTLDKGLEVVGASKHQALYLAPGTYQLNDNVTFADDVNQGEQNNARLIGKTGNPDDVVIDGQGLYWWHQSGQNRGICSVTFSNLYANATQALRLDYYSGVVDYDDTTVRVFSNCVVKCCTAAGSELIQILGRTAMRDCKILNCTVSGSGKSIVNAKGGAQIDDCVFADNTAGGSIVELAYSSAARDKVCKSHIKGSLFLRNQASQISYYMPIVDSCLFLTNTTSGAVCYYPKNYNFGAPLRILNTVFDKNETTSAVGCSGIDFQNATLTNSLIENCVFANGLAPNGSGTGSNNGHGGALRLYPTSLQGTGLTVRNVLFSRYRNASDSATTSKSEGSAVAVIFAPTISGTGNVVFENCSFVDNQLRDYESYGAKVAAAVYVSAASNTRIAFTNCVFSNVKEDGTYGHGIKFKDSTPYALMSHCLFRTSINYAFAEEQGIKNGVDPCFKHGSYVPTADSPLVDAGVNNPSWMTDAYDLQRKPDGTLIGKPFRSRIYNDTVDIGAYEYGVDEASPGFILLVF